jgi:hypothetical protein
MGRGVVPAPRRRRSRRVESGIGQQSQLELENRPAVRRGDGQQVTQRGLEATRHLWRPGADHAQLVEGQVDEVTPRHLRFREADDALPVPLVAVRQGPAGQLPEDVVETVDGLHRCGGVLER